jgi:indole-3-glycerol phosphate synthase
MLKKVQIFKALDIELKKQKGPVAINKDAHKGHYSLKEELSQPGISIITEIAGGNPLRGQVRDSYRASTHAKSLVENGATVISVVTDRFLFYGEDKHLSDVRAAVKVPLIRYDFIFEEYQIEESKILGADAIVLMAYLLEPDRLIALQKLARAKNLDVIVEISSKADLKRALDCGADIVCVRGRNLNNWQTNWESALTLLEKVPQNKCLRIFEAGVCNIGQIQQLEDMGVHGVIVGDVLLDEFYPGKKLAQILAGTDALKKLPKTRIKQTAILKKDESIKKTSAKAAEGTKLVAGILPNNKEVLSTKITKASVKVKKANQNTTSTSNNSSDLVVRKTKTSTKKPVGKKLIADSSTKVNFVKREVTAKKVVKKSKTIIK